MNQAGLIPHPSSLEDRRGAAYCLEAFANLNAREDKTEQAMRLWGVAERLREEIGAPLTPDEREEYDADLASACQALGEEASSKARAEGRAMTMERAIAYALEKEA